MSEYFKNLFRASSQWVNCLFRGSPDVHFSSRCYIERVNGKSWGKWCEKVINMAFKAIKGVDDHCYKSLKNDVRYMQTNIKRLKPYKEERKES